MTNALMFFLLYPETKGRELEEMDWLFRTTPWIVPGSGAESLKLGQRERELAESESADLEKFYGEIQC